MSQDGTGLRLIQVRTGTDPGQHWDRSRMGMGQIWDWDRSGMVPGQILDWDRSRMGPGQIWDGTMTDPGQQGRGPGQHGTGGNVR